MDIQASIGGGICGLHTTVEAISADGMTVTVRIESDCPLVSKMAAELTSLDALDELMRRPYIATTPALLSAKHKLHTTCVVPTGILKAVEAAAGLALPGQCEIRLARIE